MAPADTLTTDEHLYWIIDTTDDHGNDLRIPYTGTYTQARAECHQFHPGATIEPCPS